MTAFSDDLESKIVEHFLRNTSQTSPVTVYLALFESDPLDTGAGTECSFTNYARQVAAWGAVAAGQTDNDSEITFPAQGDAGTVVVTHVGVFVALTIGNLMIHGALSASKSLQQNDVLVFAAAALTLTID